MINIFGMVDLEQRVAEAHEAHDDYREATALIDLIYAMYEAGSSNTSLVAHVERAWLLAEGKFAWDQLHRLSLLFAEISLREENWLRLYDHAANSCAYAVMAGEDALLANAMQRIDTILLQLRGNRLADRAVAFCEMLLAYEEASGFGGPLPAFAEHYSAELEHALADTGSGNPPEA